ncbi:xylulose kinase [Lucilia sericata]|uniref:xylulose kinase n=1 Tax=Lucilia sericata TaxID=13632 RepID=UPI0018A846AC|nr:xylulose kinase [Lucilia sericata]XP_037828527.1 xylulose kinase [Lucilia sericata]XP_037828528.1 xylulose kinase [Lucilia sericata]
MKMNSTAVDEEKSTYLGFDLSTQKLKAVQLNNELKVLVTAEVQFDTDLPEFRTTGGVNAGPRKNEYFVQPVMWVKALDIVMDRLVMEGADLSTVVALGGSAQQHGSLYWSRHGVETLKNLDPDKFLHLQVDDSAFVLTRTPIWMDGSAENQCLEMEMAIGGRTEMVSLTGSKCYPRFTGPQIRKVYQQRTHAYEDSKRISLVSSFLASIFLGDVAPIDYADASGMNLFDINTKTWSKACLNACAPDLEERLGTPVKTSSIIGNICEFFVQRFGMPETCKVAAFTGDNPSALSGMLVEKGCLVMSLGTSDTLMMNLEKPPVLEEGHVLCHPTDEDQFMGLLCFRNGSLVRDAIKRSEAQNSWQIFSQLLDSTPRGNYGNMAIHFHTMEIIPTAKGTLRWNKSHTTSSPDAAKGISKFTSPEAEIRALIEGQMLHRRAVAADMGFHFGEETKIIATGGASVNKSILQVISDVFNAPVYIQKASEAALQGAAYRAKYAKYIDDLRQDISNMSKTNQDAGDEVEKEDTKTNVDILSYYDFIISYLPNLLERVCEPSKDSDEIYTPMLERYRQMANILQSSK